MERPCPNRSLRRRTRTWRNGETRKSIRRTPATRSRVTSSPSAIPRLTPSIEGVSLGIADGELVTRLRVAGVRLIDFLVSPLRHVRVRLRNDLFGQGRSIRCLPGVWLCDGNGRVELRRAHVPHTGR